MLSCVNTDISLSGFLLILLFNTAVVRIAPPSSTGKDRMSNKLILNVNGHSLLTPPVTKKGITVLLL